jgi:phosphoserine phosphatase
VVRSNSLRVTALLAAAAGIVLTILCGGHPPARAQDLPANSAGLLSWNDTPTKKAILDFIRRVTDRTHADYVPPEERIATFDNDGTLWCEQPLYVQLLFIFDRVKALAPQHPEWQVRQPFKAILNNDEKTYLAFGETGWTEVLAATQAGMTPEEFHQLVMDWLATARHPRFRRPYTECVYQPMLELLTFLRENDFQNFIVSGGGIEFMRPWTGKIYGVPPERVVGSTIKTKFEIRNGQPLLMRLPEVNFVDDGPGKPVGIIQHIGRRPLMAFGNSDGDLEMLQWTTAGSGARFGLIVHHTDAQREYAYDRHSTVGRLDKALDAATRHGWTVVDMKKDWKTIFPFERPGRQ